MQLCGAGSKFAAAKLPVARPSVLFRNRVIRNCECGAKEVIIEIRTSSIIAARIDLGVSLKRMRFAARKMEADIDSDLRLNTSHATRENHFARISGSA